MFEGKLGKQMMIERGHVSPTCTLPDECGGSLIYSETSAGRDVCAGCNHDRLDCKGRPKKQEDIVYPEREDDWRNLPRRKL